MPLSYCDFVLECGSQLHWSTHMPRTAQAMYDAGLLAPYCPDESTCVQCTFLCCPCDKWLTNTPSKRVLHCSLCNTSGQDVERTCCMTGMLTKSFTMPSYNIRASCATYARQGAYHGNASIPYTGH